ncbi:MAG: STAS domain-containing protein [Cellulosimicrobium funkei]
MGSTGTGGVHVEDGGRRWVMWGQIDFAVTHAVKARLAATIDGPPKTVDLTAVTFRDSSGLHLLLMTVTEESRPRLLGVPPQVLEILEFSHALDLVEIVGPDEVPPPDEPAGALAG